MQSERYWIERSFQDAIDLAGMSNYQVRNWKAWHHHMSLVLLAMFWVVKEKQHFMTITTKTTPQDIAKIIQTLLPLNPKTPLSIVKIIIRNHRNRKRSRRCKMKKEPTNTLLVKAKCVCFPSRNTLGSAIFSIFLFI